MWPELLLISSSPTSLARDLGRLKVFALVRATIIFSLIATAFCVGVGLQWGAIALTMIASATILQSSYLIAGLLSEAPSPRAVSRTNSPTDLIRTAQLAIGEELRTHFQTPQDLPSPLSARIEQLTLQ
jgi:hypothetical protein